jgi:proline-specific peptidase
LSDEREGFVTVTDGQVWFRAVGTQHNAVPLLCLHGGPGFPHDYLEPLEDLSDERPVIFYDQLGCGKSAAHAPGMSWNVARFVEELVAVREQLALSDVIIFGNSWGGWLLLQYMLDRSPDVRGLILSSAAPSVPQFAIDADQLRRALPPSVQEVLDEHERQGFFSCPEYQGAAAEFYRRHLCRTSPWPSCVERTFAGLGTEVYQAMWGPSEFGPVTGVLRDWDVTDRLGEIHAPTLVTGGRFDEARPSQMKVLADGLSNAELSIFENSAHLAFIDERESYIIRLREFLHKVDNSPTDRPVWRLAKEQG